MFSGKICRGKITLWEKRKFLRKLGLLLMKVKLQQNQKMRPDEHKKKRSAQYQRKHGGGGAKGEKKDNDKSGAKSGKQGSSKSAKTVAQTPRPHAALPPQKATTVDSASDTEDEEHASATQQKSFRRREIASNWAKYDMPPVETDESSATPKGQDFNKLLQGSGSAIAHFRFKDEESWEGDSDGDTAPSALFLDCSRLADNLDCLPLYTQLRLDTDIFSSEQVAAMDKAADQQRALKGLPSLSQRDDEKSSSSQPSSTVSETSRSLPAGQAQPNASTVKTKPCADAQHTETTQSKGFSDADLDCLLESNDTDVRDKGEAELEKGGHRLNGSEVHKNISHTKAAQGKPQAKTAVLKTGQKSQRTTVGFSDADLDSLLGSNDAGDGEGAVAGSGKAVPETSKGVTEQDLDELLSMDTPQTNPTPGVSIDTNQKEKVSETAAESAELEDWLDSVLDS